MNHQKKLMVLKTRKKLGVALALKSLYGIKPFATSLPVVMYAASSQETASKIKPLNLT